MKASDWIVALSRKIAETGEDLEVLTYDSYHLTMSTPTHIQTRTLQNLDGTSATHKIYVLASSPPNAGDY